MILFAVMSLTEISFAQTKDAILYEESTVERYGDSFRFIWFNTKSKFSFNWNNSLETRHC